MERDKLKDYRTKAHLKERRSTRDQKKEKEEEKIFFSSDFQFCCCVMMYLMGYSSMASDSYRIPIEADRMKATQAKKGCRQKH